MFEIQKKKKLIQYLIFKLRKTKEKYGLFGISLLIISVISIIVGIFISYVFISKISTSVKLIENGEEINEQLKQIDHFYKLDINDLDFIDLN